MIKRQQLESIISLNKEIHEEISSIVERDLAVYSQDGINIAESVALHLNEKCEFIQIPLEDKKIGGLMIKKGNNFYCMINTAQPRAFQNFVYLHEFYHLHHHAEEKIHLIQNSVENETNLDERKANYYASLMLLNKDILRRQYYYLSKDRDYDLKTCIYFLMNLFKTTYKTIIIRLYEIKCIEDFALLHDNFSYDFEEASSKFNALGLDRSIIEPSNTKSVGNIENYIKTVEEKKLMLEDFINLNKEKYYEIMKKIGE